MVRILRGVMLTAALTVGAAAAAQGQTAPAGYIYDFQVAHPANLSTYQQFTTSFVAAFSSTVVSFAFREVPAYWGFDDVSVANGAGPNLLQDPGFESATDGQLVPTGWGRWIQPIDVSAIGTIASPSAPYGCSNYGPHGGLEFWCDGSVEGYDALYQSVATTIGQTYTISWFMSDNSGSQPTNPNIDMFVYAGQDIPIGTIPLSTTPEPATMTLLATGLVGMAGIARRRRRA